jgi:hypothetical protein
MRIMASQTIRTTVAMSALVATILTSVPAQANGVVLRSACWSPAETSALKVRQMQVFLMVSALQCTLRGDTGMRASYNRFIKNSARELTGNAALLKARYAADHGAGGVTQFDRYMTQLANNFSADPAASSDCSRVANVAEAAAGENADGLARIASHLFPDADRTVKACVAPSRLAGLKIE